MKNFRSMLFLLLAGLLLVSSSCAQSSRPEGALLPVEHFQKQLSQQSDAVLVDVRTPEEFAKGHLPQAGNINWKADDFTDRISRLEKSAPVYVYCMSGARSAAAAEKMRSMGFTSVYELEGGILKWRSAGLPETGGNPAPGMTRSDFDALLQGDQLVLVDFYADWCAPCKKMKPWLDEISRDMAATVKVVRINADDHQALMKEMQVDTLPVLQLYRGGRMIWTDTGFLEKEEVLKVLQ